MAALDDSKEKKYLLKEVLFNSQFIKEDNAQDLLRNDLLSEIMKESSRRDELIKEKYLENNQIKSSLIKIHEQILDNKHKRQTFGPGTFTGLQGKLNCMILTKNVLENKLGWSVSEIVNKINYETLYRYKLRCTKTCFKHIYELIIDIYPEAGLKPYYFKKASYVWHDKKGNMKENLVRESIREFIEILTNPRGKYKYKFNRMPQWANYKLFREPILPFNTNLSYMLSHCFNNSHIKALMFAYPEENLKPYYFSNVPNKYWSGEKGLEHAKEVMKELMDILTNPKGEYKLSKEEVRKLFKFKTYGKPILPYRKNMRGMLQTLFKNSPSAPFKLLQMVEDET